MEEQSEPLAPDSRDTELFAHTEDFASTLFVPAESAQRVQHRRTHQRQTSSVSYLQYPHDYLHDDGSGGGESGSRVPSSDAASQQGPKEQARPAAVDEGGQSSRPHFLLSWWQEMLACITFVAALLAMFATLYYYAHRTSPDWPSWLSLNTVIAIYAVILKSAILLVTAEGIGQLKWSWLATGKPLVDLARYDDASRGPWGALRLLWRLRWHDLLASLGALITVLAMVVDPFAQQILRYYECPVVKANINATVPRSNLYVEAGPIYQDSFQTRNIIPEVQKAINAGIFGPGRLVLADCLTGNCTWPSQYSTVGWCSSCEDVTDLLAFKRSDKNTSLADNFEIQTSIPGGVSCTMAKDNLRPQYAAMGYAPTPDVSPEIGVTQYASVFDFVLGKNAFGAVDPVTQLPWTDCNDTALSDSWKCRGYGAARCRTYPCVKTYAADIHAGKLRETLVDVQDTWSNAIDATWSYSAVAMVDTECLGADGRSALGAIGYAFEPGQRWIPYNVTVPSSAWSKPNDTLPTLGIRESCIYAVDQRFVNSLAGYLGKYLEGSVSQITYTPFAGFSGSRIVQEFFNFGIADLLHVDQLFANMTDSLTNYMRQTQSIGFNAPAIGSVQEQKACVRVVWAWLVFPTAVVILTLLFISIVVSSTRPASNGPEIWKSSPLPLVYRSLENDGYSGRERTFGNDVGHLRALHSFARGTTVKVDAQRNETPRFLVHIPAKQ